MDPADVIVGDPEGAGVQGRTSIVQREAPEILDPGCFLREFLLREPGVTHMSRELAESCAGHCRTRSGGAPVRVVKGEYWKYKAKWEDWK